MLKMAKQIIAQSDLQAVRIDMKSDPGRVAEYRIELVAFPRAPGSGPTIHACPECGAPDTLNPALNYADAREMAKEYLLSSVLLLRRVLPDRVGEIEGVLTALDR
jgi:hypothetical protein